MNGEAGCLVRKPAGGQQPAALPADMIFVVGREWEVWVYRDGDLRNQEKVLSEATMRRYFAAVPGSFSGVKPGES